MTSNQLPRSILNQLSVDAFKVELKKRLDDVQAQLACFELEQHALCERAVRARKHGRAALEFVREPEFNYYSWEEEPFILVKERDCCDTRIKVRVTSRWQRKLQQLAAKRKDLLETQRWLKRTPVDKPAIIAEIVRKDKEAVQGIEQIIHGVIQRRFFFRRGLMPRLKPRKQLRKGKRRHHESWKQRRWNLRNLVQSSGGACCYCGKPVVLSRGIDQTATIDHVVPRSRGGLDVVENMKLSCFKCNQHKGTGISFDVYLEEEQ